MARKKKKVTTKKKARKTLKRSSVATTKAEIARLRNDAVRDAVRISQLERHLALATRDVKALQAKYANKDRLHLEEFRGRQAAEAEVKRLEKSNGDWRVYALRMEEALKTVYAARDKLRASHEALLRERADMHSKAAVAKINKDAQERADLVPGLLRAILAELRGEAVILKRDPIPMPGDSDA